MLCKHEIEIDPLPPRTPGCEECLKTGTPWVHLRLCLSCGHVGCCDSSPGRHATKHFHHTAHPVIASLSRASGGPGATSIGRRRTSRSKPCRTCGTESGSRWTWRRLKHGRARLAVRRLSQARRGPDGRAGPLPLDEAASITGTGRSSSRSATGTSSFSSSSPARSRSSTNPGRRRRPSRSRGPGSSPATWRN